MTGFLIELIQKVSTTAAVSFVSLPLAKYILDSYLKKREKWLSPSLDLLENLESNESLEAEFRQLAFERYRSEAFFTLSGIKVKHPREIGPLFRLEKNLDPKFSWPTIKSAYPMFLVPSEEDMSVRITTQQKCEHYALYTIAFLMLLSVGTMLLALIDNPNIMIISALVLLAMFASLVAIQHFDAPYRNAVRLQKHFTGGREVN